MMDRQQLGTEGPVVSELCLGTGGFGTAVSQDAAWAIMDRYAEAGGNFLDTAHVYAAWLPDGAGASERTIGSWVAARGCREDVVIGTKGGHPDLRSMDVSRLAPDDIASDLHESLDRLGTDYVDLYWLHRDDPSVPVGEIMDALSQHVGGGLVRAIGCSNWTPQRQEEAAAWSRQHGKPSLCASQIGYSLARAKAGAAGYAGMLYMDDATHAFHQRTGIPVVAYSSQAGGFFSGKYAANDDPASVANQGVVRTYYSEPNFQRLERAQQLAAKHGRRANEVNLAYLLSQPFHVVPIVGPRTEQQIEASCAAAGWRLSEDACRFLEGES